MSARGFTLVDLLVVMAILGLLVGLVPLAIGKGLPGAELRAGARALAAGLRQSRATAIYENRPIRFTVDLDGRRFAMTGAGDWQDLSGDYALDLETARSEMLSESEGGIGFYPNGSSTGGRISLNGKGRAYHVMVDWLNGQVEIVE